MTDEVIEVIETRPEVIELVERGPQGPAGVDAGEIVTAETPAGATDGTNVVLGTFYPYKPLTLRVFLNGLRQREGNDYLETGVAELTMTDPPLPGDDLLIDYVINQ